MCAINNAIHQYFDKVLVLTVDRFKERQEKVKKNLTGIDFDFFYGVDKNELNEKLNSYDFLLKILFTSFTLGAGFKGGEVTPLFYIGATLDNALVWFIPLLMALLAGITSGSCPCFKVGQGRCWIGVIRFVRWLRPSNVAGASQRFRPAIWRNCATVQTVWSL